MRRATIYIALLLIAGLSTHLVDWLLVKPKYNVSGTITRDGKPLEWKSDEGVLDVKFVPLDRTRDDRVYRAETTTSAGAYTIRIPAGSYRVSMQQLDPYPTHDLLDFALNMKDSFIHRDVTKNDEVIDIDIPKILKAKGK